MKYDQNGQKSQDQLHPQSRQDHQGGQGKRSVRATAHAAVGTQPTPRNHLNVNEENKSEDGTAPSRTRK